MAYRPSPGEPLDSNGYPIYAPAQHERVNEMGYSPYADLDWRAEEEYLRQEAAKRGLASTPGDLQTMKQNYYNSGPNGGEGGSRDAVRALLTGQYDRRSNNTPGGGSNDRGQEFHTSSGQLVPGGSGPDIYTDPRESNGGLREAPKTYARSASPDAWYPGGSASFDETTGRYRDPSLGSPQTLADLLLARYLAR